ncbi:hypothetical protein GYB59_01435 [bacterium]|nr:hypothetical protein [bacterium]
MNSSASTPEQAALIKELIALADEMERFADDQTEQLDFETYAALVELETRLLAFANLLATHDTENLIRDEIVSASRFLNDLKKEATIA